MTNIIVAFQKPKDAAGIKNILQHNGLRVSATALSGAQALSHCEELGQGILISGYRFDDMQSTEIFENLPDTYEMLVIASPSRWTDVPVPRGMVTLDMPLKVNDLISTVDMMTESRKRAVRRRLRSKPDIAKKRDPAQEAAILRAKALLMERNNMSESEAHRYLQKCAMNSARSMAETADMLVYMLDR